MTLRLFLATFSLAGVLCLSGCGSGGAGPERVAVFGTVERAGATLSNAPLSNAPLSNATISYLPGEGHSGPGAVTTVDDGQYRFTAANGPVAGPHRVVIRLNPPGEGVSKTDLIKPTKAPSDAAGPTNWEFQVDVPAEGSFEKSFVLE